VLLAIFLLTINPEARFKKRTVQSDLSFSGSVSLRRKGSSDRLIGTPMQKWGYYTIHCEKYLLQVA
jgi:hypothetical protein